MRFGDSMQDMRCWIYIWISKRVRTDLSAINLLIYEECMLQNTHLEGLEASVKRFGDIVEEIRRKPYDLLDASKNIFDRDFLEFNVHINDLELGVQVCILLNLSVQPKIVVRSLRQSLADFDQELLGSNLHINNLKLVSRCFSCFASACNLQFNSRMKLVGSPYIVLLGVVISLTGS